MNACMFVRERMYKMNACMLECMLVTVHMCERVHVPAGACVHVGVRVGVWEKINVYVCT